MAEQEKKLEASLLQPREGAGKYWWETFLRGHISDINRRFNQAKALYLTNPSTAPVDLFSYIREAALCYEIGRYLPAIASASLSAKLILERDQRVQCHPSVVRYDQEGIALCSDNLKLARDLGLPTEALLSENEKIDGGATIIFVERSNRVIRGDVLGWFRGISDYSPTFEHEALDQLEKAQRFVVAWFNTFPDNETRHP